MRPVSFNAGLVNPYNHLSRQKANPGINFGEITDPKENEPLVALPNGHLVGKDLLHYVLDQIDRLLSKRNGKETFDHLIRAYTRIHTMPPEHMEQLIRLGLLTDKPPIKRGAIFPQGRFVGLQAIIKACGKEDENGTFVFVGPTIKWFIVRDLNQKPPRNL